MSYFSRFSEKLVHRLVWPSLLLSIVAVGLISFVTYHVVRETLRDSVANQLQVAAELQERELQRWIEDQKRKVVFISRAPAVRTWIGDLLSRDPEHPYYIRAYRELSEYLYSYIKNFPGLREIMVLSNHGGKVLFSTQEDNEGEYRFRDSFFRKGRERLYLQGVYPWRETTEPTITIARPLLGAQGNRQGVLAVHLNLERMDAVVSEHPGLGRTGEIYLVDKFNTFINAERFGREDFQRGVHTEGIDRAVAGGEGLAYYRNYKGVPVVGYYRWQPDLEVAILAEISRVEAFAPARDIGLIIASIGLILTFLLSAGTVFFATRVSEPLVRMAGMAEKVAEGDFSIQVPVAERDETGALARSLNSMVARLNHVYDELATSAEHFRTVFNLSPYPIGVQRFSDGVFVDVNQGFTRLFDIPEQDALGRTASDLKLWSSEVARLRFIVQLKEVREVNDFEAAFVDSAENIFVGMISARLIDLSGEPHVISILRDVSEQREIEQRLRETRDRLQLLIRRMPVACISWNRDFTVALWNPKAEEVFGFSAAEAVGRHAFDLIVPASIQDQVLPVWRQLMQRDETNRSQNRNVTRDGRIILCDWSNTSLRDERGEAIGVISMVRDITDEKAAEENLVHQKELIQTILNAIPAPIFYKDATGIYQGCNEAFCDYLGFEHDQIVGHTVFDVAPPDKASVYEEADQQLLKRGGIQIYEAKVRFADGSDRDVVFHKAVYRNPDGTVGGLVGNMLDVTEIRQVEAELAESELNYREIFNASSEAIIIRDARTGEMVDVNQAMLKMYGYSYDQALLTTIDELTSGEFPYTVEKAYEYIAAAKAGVPQLFEWKARKSDGQLFWVEIALKISIIRGEERLLAVIRDVGERKEAERVHRESEERFHLLIEHAADALYLHDENGVILTVNQRACDSLGYDRHEILGMTFDQLEEKLSHEELKDFWSTLETGRSSAFEGRHMCKDGKSFPVDINVVKFRFQDAHFYLAVARDITDRKATEAELERYRNRLEDLVMERTRQLERAQEELIRKERMAVLGQLTATVSHELRNPLGTIKNAVYLLGKHLQTENPTNIENTLALANRNINRCDNIINELLDYSRQQEWTPVVIEIGDWLDAILSELERPVDVRVEREYRDDFTISGDPERLRRAIINIYINALQALDEVDSGGKCLKVYTEAAEKRLLIVFSDNGPGIDKETLPQIFEPMFSTKSFGVGLGMSIVQTIMAEHGGGVEVDSRPGEGTTVSLWLPRAGSEQ